LKERPTSGMRSYELRVVILPKDIPHGCVLALNCSGMHDTAWVLVAPDGGSVFAVTLERISRIKRDGVSHMSD
jgi:hypothetical protein